MHVVILGNGITGATAALRLRELDPRARITMISAESRYPYSRPALMYVFMGHMRYADTKPWEDRVWEDARIDLVRDFATRLEPEERVLHLHRGGALPFDKLLLATGSKTNKFGWPGQDLRGVQGLYGLPDLDTLAANLPGTGRAVIVGGGLIGIELAEMLHSRGCPVTLLVREESYWSNVLPPEESAMVNRAIEKAGFDLRLSTELAEIEDDGGGRCAAVITKAGERIACEIVGLTAGVSPETSLVDGTDIEVGRGIRVDRSLRTRRYAHILAAGDCAEVGDDADTRVWQVWYTGRSQGKVAGEVLAGRDSEWREGTWYNSAKFLDLEYQTYGAVGRIAPENSESLWWEDDRVARGLRIVYRDDSSKHVLGFNCMGLRMRHEVCRDWIESERGLDYVLENLADANFDHEFCKRYEAEAVTRLQEGQRG